MHTVVKERLISFICSCCDKYGIIDYIEVVISLVTFGLGVITIIAGARYISQKRRDAKFGFYINLRIYIKQFAYYYTHYNEITDYLCAKEIREKILETTLQQDLADILIPIYVSLCDEFIEFISHADNNVVPKHDKKSKINKTDEWNKWYDSLLIMVEFAQISKFLGKNITPYISDDQANEYIKLKKEFERSFKFVGKKLDRTLRKSK